MQLCHVIKSSLNFVHNIGQNYIEIETLHQRYSRQRCCGYNPCPNRTLDFGHFHSGTSLRKTSGCVVDKLGNIHIQLPI